MKKNLLKGVMAMALMAMSLPMQADGVKWLEKCLDASKITVNKGTTTIEGNVLKIAGTAANEINITLTPGEAMAMTNGQTYVVVEANTTFDHTKKMDHLKVGNVQLGNKTGSLVGFTKNVNGHILNVFSVLDNRGKADDGNAQALKASLDYLFNNESLAPTEASFYLRPKTALADDAAIEIYNIGFYSLGDILSEYSDLATNSWRFTKSDLSEVESYNGDNNTRVRINNLNGTTTLEYNYLRARTLSNMPSKYTNLDLRNMNLEDNQTEALDKDAFAGLSFSTILLQETQYKLFPTLNQAVVFPNATYFAYKDGVAPADIAAKTDGNKSVKAYSYTRNFKAGNNSCVLPFDVNAEDLTGIGLAAYVFDSYANGKVNFKSAEGVIAAGTPLMIKAETAGLYLIPAAETPNLLSDISGYKETMDAQGNKFVGSFINEVPSTYVNRYGLDKTATSFTKMGDEIHTTYYRAFLSLKDATAEAKPIVMTFDGETTGISQVNVEKVADDAYYNLQGVKMNPNNLPHGIYIHQGKKVVK